MRGKGEGESEKNCYKWQLATPFDGGKEHTEGGGQKKKQYAYIDETKSEPDHAPHTHTESEQCSIISEEKSSN